MTQQVLDAPFQVKALAEAGDFEGYASIFDVVDQGRDVVAPGAFARSLGAWAAKGRLPALLWQHDATEPIGVFREMREDGRGLHVAGRLFIDDIPRARQAHALLKAGGLSGLSIGFRTVEADFDEVARVRRLRELELHEVSLVTFPALDAARVSNVKAGPRIATIREFEAFLRDAGGFSNAAAKSIAGGGFKAAAAPRDEAAELLSLVRAHLSRLGRLTTQTQAR
jgi:hypothetical protein